MHWSSWQSMVRSCAPGYRQIKVHTAATSTDVEHLLTAVAGLAQSIEGLRVSNASAAVSGARLAATAAGAAERRW